MEHWEELAPGGLRLLWDDALFPPGTDSFLLSALPRLRPGLRVCDLGCGTGLVGFLLLQRQRSLSLTGVDREERAMTLARRCAAENGLADRAVFETRILDILGEESDEAQIQAQRDAEYRRKVLDAFLEYGKLKSIPAQRKKERILLEGNIPSPIKPPSGCKFHTRCYMACDKCKRVPPELREVEPGHFLACHFPEKKLDENGNYLFELPKMEKKSNRTAAQEPQA